MYGCAGFVVVPDRGGEGEDALQDADPGAAGSVTAVAFERTPHAASKSPVRLEGRALAVCELSSPCRVVLGLVSLQRLHGYPGVSHQRAD